ncbi:hypothetical protein [Kitasatospora sp. NPDC057223]|uniref:hypothetical protein n=1 Tax=Kitasatospora sp. NPDC057223 TaxID=3346055 RepID=UPI0036409C68
MTHKDLRPFGGDSSGESPTERLLREALTARAGQISAHDLRSAEPPSGQVRRLRPLYIAAVPLFGLAAVTAFALLGFHGDPVAKRDEGPPAASMSADPSPSAAVTSSPSPSESASATIGAMAQDTAPAADPLATASSPSVPTTAGTASATAAPGHPANGIGLRFSGLSGVQVAAGAGSVAFSVTWTNTTQQRYDSVAPVVAARAFGAAGASGTAVRGTLQRSDAGGWTTVQLSQLTGGAYQQSGDAAAFALEPGASRTIQYRLDLAADSGTGDLPVEAFGYLPAAEGRAVAGSALATVTVLKPATAERQRPVLRLVSGPSELTVGRTPTQFQLAVSNPGGVKMTALQPTITMNDSFSPGSTEHHLKPEEVVAEALVAGAWRKLPTSFDATRMIVVDTSLLDRSLAPGAEALFDIRIGIVEGWTAGNGLDLVLGAVGDGAVGDTISTRPSKFYFPM